MGKLIKLVVVLALIGAGIYFAVSQMSDSSTSVKDQIPSDGVRVEEKYGFTSGGVEGG